MSDDDEVKATDYLARTVIEPEKIGQIGFIHHKAQAGAAKRGKPKQSADQPRSVSSKQRNSRKRRGA